MTSTLMLKVDGVMTAATTRGIEDGAGGETEVKSTVAVVRVLVVGCGICGRRYGGASRHSEEPEQGCSEGVGVK